MNNRAKIFCVSCGREIGNFRTDNPTKGKLEITCDKCDSEFDLTFPLENTTVILKRYKGRIGFNIQTKGYPETFCPFSGMSGKTKLLVPELDFRFQCQDKKCGKTFHVLYDEEAFS